MNKRYGTSNDADDKLVRGIKRKTRKGGVRLIRLAPTFRRDGAVTAIGAAKS